MAYWNERGLYELLVFNIKEYKNKNSGANMCLCVYFLTFPIEIAWKQGHPNNNKHNLNSDLGFLILLSPRWARTPWRKVWSRGEEGKGMSVEHHLIPENSKRLKWWKNMPKEHLEGFY